jgi:hypothetical protein
VNTNRDALFVRFVTGLFALLVLYGTAMLLVLLVGEPALASKMLSAFSSMFTGTLGLGGGYLLGARTNGNNNKHPE